MMGVADLIPYVSNARMHSDEQVTQIAASIREFGFISPIIVDGERNIIAGHGRLMAAKKLGLEKVPTLEVTHLSEAQRKAYVLADNQLAMNADWDMDLLKVELEGLQSENFDISLLGFDDDLITKLLDDQAEKLTDEDKDSEIVDCFDDEMVMKLKFNFEQYEKVNNYLLSINDSKEIALIQLVDKNV